MEKKEDQGKTAENLMTQITKDLKEEVARTDKQPITAEKVF